MSAGTWIGFAAFAVLATGLWLYSGWVMGIVGKRKNDRR